MVALQAAVDAELAEEAAWDGGDGEDPFRGSGPGSALSFFLPEPAPFSSCLPASPEFVVKALERGVERAPRR